MPLVVEFALPLGATKPLNGADPRGFGGAGVPAVPVTAPESATASVKRWTFTVFGKMQSAEFGSAPTAHEVGSPLELALAACGAPVVPGPTRRIFDATGLPGVIAL